MVNVKRRTRLLSASAVLTALGVVIIYLVGVLPTMQLAFAAIAGLLPALTVLAGGVGWGALTYAATGLLALILVPDKGAALAYILVFGHWPLVKSVIESRVKNRVLEWALKLAACNIVFTLLFLAVRLFSIDISEFGMPVWALYLVGNLCFVLYDRCFTGLITAFGGRFLKFLFK